MLKSPAYMLCKGLNGLLNIFCALAEPRYLPPVLADNWSKLPKERYTLFRTTDTNVMVVFLLGNYVVPWVLDIFNMFQTVIGSYNPSLQTVTGSHNTGIVCVKQLGGN